METGTLGERRQADVDALYAEAKQAVAQAANRVRDATERVREAASALADDHQRHGKVLDGEIIHSMPGPDTVARARRLLARLELMVRDLEERWRFLERGLASGADGRSLADDPGAGLVDPGVLAMRVLEAQEQERAQLAEELHDGPAQALSNATFQVEIVDRALRVDPAAAGAELRLLRQLLDREMSQMRAFINELRPAMESDHSLWEALHDAAARLTSETGIAVEVDLAAPEGLLDQVQRTAVLRVALEALRNCRKHSAAGHVRVATWLAEDGSGPPGWLLEVHDDGRGFAVDEVLEGTSRRHFGLRFMRERAQLVGATLEIVSGQETGTSVRLRLDPREGSR
jgi:signal transduction histidine kinase